MGRGECWSPSQVRCLLCDGNMGPDASCTRSRWTLPARPLPLRSALGAEWSCVCSGASTAMGHSTPKRAENLRGSSLSSNTKSRAWRFRVGQSGLCEIFSVVSFASSSCWQKGYSRSRNCSFARQFQRQEGRHVSLSLFFSP